MLISSEKEQISLPSDVAEDYLKSSPNGSCADSLDRFRLVAKLPDSTQLPSSYTDVNVVPEHRKSELEQLISNLEGEIVQLKLKEKSLNEKRRAALNKIFDIKGGIRVFCRVRPFLSTNQRRVQEPVSIGMDKIAVQSVGIGKEFRFDKVFHQVASQDDVFVEVEPILRSVLDGHNVCILAYGQTGTGKTFTMDGSNDQPGIVPRALVELFCQASLDNSASVTFSMSMLEVYMGTLKDLLATRPSCRTYETVSRCNLNIQTDPKGVVEIEGLTEVQIPDISKAKWWYSKGRRVRSTSWTSVNDASSRSHCLTRITIFRRSNPLEAKAELSKLWMVDLGGSERLLKTGATGQTLDEGRAINLSLSALGDVIAALRRKKGHVPYRNSKLTQILKNSLGYGSKVLLLVHVNPYEDDVGETICSLSFAYRARAIESNREVPEDMKKQRERRISEIEEEMREMEGECQKIRNQIKNAELLSNENKRLLSVTYAVREDEDKNARSSKEDLQKITESPRTTEKEIEKNTTESLPRFMTSTVASRQRHSASEREIVRRATTMRSETRSSVQFSASQLVSYSDIRSRTIIRNSSKKSQYVEAKALLRDGPGFSNLDFKTTSMPKSKIVISSDPNLRVTLGRHRRRMSDLI